MSCRAFPYLVGLGSDNISRFKDYVCPSCVARVVRSSAFIENSPMNTIAFALTAVSAPSLPIKGSDVHDARHLPQSRGNGK